MPAVAAQKLVEQSFGSRLVGLLDAGIFFCLAAALAYREVLHDHQAFPRNRWHIGHRREDDIAGGGTVRV